MISPASRAHRILKRLPAYASLEAQVPMPGLPEIDDGDAFLGAYVNASEVAIIFTSSGFRVGYLGGEWGSFTRYSELKSAVVMLEKHPHQVLLHCHDNRSVLVPVDRVSNGKFLDSLEVLRFFDRVIDDMKRED